MVDQATIDSNKEARKAAGERQRLLQQAEIDATLAPYLLRAPAKEVLDTIQYRHDALYGRTYAVVPPSSSDLTNAALRLLGGGSEIAVELSLGQSLVNHAEGDTYNRKVGRVVAVAKLQKQMFKLTDVHVDEKRTTYTLVLGGLSLYFYLSHGKDFAFFSSLSDSSRRKPQRGVTPKYVW
jgi:hypothetical protein